MNLPNKISIARILLIPFFVFFLLAPIKLGSFLGVEIKVLIALIIFAIASVTDWVDGYLARKLKLVTNLGKFLDPLADKLLMTAGFIALVEMGIAPAWIVIVIISREFAVTGLRVIAADAGVVIAAANSGKVKTTVQIITVILLMLDLNDVINSLMLWASAIITIYSGIEYFAKNKQVFNTKK